LRFTHTMCHGCVSRALRDPEITMVVARLTQPWHFHVKSGLGPCCWAVRHRGRRSVRTVPVSAKKVESARVAGCCVMLCMTSVESATTLLTIGALTRTASFNGKPQATALWLLGRSRLRLAVKQGSSYSTLSWWLARGFVVLWAVGFRVRHRSRRTLNTVDNH
jgi:hypothetical protein